MKKITIGNEVFYVLQVGDTIKDINGRDVYIKKMLSSTGGQGQVFLVDYCGKELVLKWYWPQYLAALRKNKIRCDVNRVPLNVNAPKQIDEVLENGDKVFYKVLTDKTDVRNPLRKNREFAWPLAITQWDGNPQKSFGYIMRYIDTNAYMQLTPIVRHPEKNYWKNVTVKLTACINMAKNFKLLHYNGGLSYQDVSDGNIYVNPQTGDVIIADNDNVIRNGVNIGTIQGTSGFIAPEVITGKASPSELTDRFSLAVLLFRILMNGPHPFEGPHSRVNDENVFYGSDPVFMFDPKDDRNRPAIGKYGEQKYARYSWAQTPRYIQELFARVFYKENLSKPEMRPTEDEWLKALMKLRSEQFACPHCRRNRNELTSLAVEADQTEVTCKICKATVRLPKVELQFNGVMRTRARLIPGKTIYQSQYNRLCNDYTKEYLRTMIENGALKLVNKSGENITVTKQDGTSVILGDGQAVAVEMGMTLRDNLGITATVVPFGG